MSNWPRPSPVGDGDPRGKGVLPPARKDPRVALTPGYLLGVVRQATTRKIAPPARLLEDGLIRRRGESDALRQAHSAVRDVLEEQDHE